MKTILQYLKEQKDMAWHNRLCYSKTYGMDTPKEGYEKEFAEAVRDCEIVEELIALVQVKETPSEQTSPCDCPFEKDGAKLLKFLKEIENYVLGDSPAHVSQSPEMR
ncbi:hypothetical protein Sgly_2985 [Syntrophobotulus glycolicus DSM 8271]|uniref:Uncharacterized protein n=2 Tax=Syntrophobotulus glycolicus (strain DSM 8271 / FlGlyR) TaxID=645991 RepID=F0SYT4_SYNGF|nr:hypothetical protein Sgly_0520 [Syntrophobotulus glycolicus DSM 8271]ADY57254.1 hypothetical protein Sgly_2985 [Syntrophobotulus glycolicus DSM 8271]